MFGEPRRHRKAPVFRELRGLQVLVWWMFDVSKGEKYWFVMHATVRRAVLATTVFTFQYCMFLENVGRLQGRYFHAALVYIVPHFRFCGGPWQWLIHYSIIMIYPTFPIVWGCYFDIHGVPRFGSVPAFKWLYLHRHSFVTFVLGVISLKVKFISKLIEICL